MVQGRGEGSGGRLPFAMTSDRNDKTSLLLGISRMISPISSPPPEASAEQ